MSSLQEALAERLSPVHWHGRYFATQCPYHDSHPDNLSFLVYPDGAVCLSATCRKRVRLEQLAKRLNYGSTLYPPATPQVPKRTVINWSQLPDLETLVETAHHTLLRYPEQGCYLQQRGMADRVLPQRLGWWDGWYTVPIYGRDRRLSGLVFRSGPSLANVADRYLTPPGQPPLLYVPDWSLVEDGESVYVPFGVFDALALVKLGLPTASPISAAWADPRLLADFRKRIIVIPDRGEEETGRRLVQGLDWRGSLCLLPYRDMLKDPADFVQAGKTKKLHQCLTNL